VDRTQDCDPVTRGPVPIRRARTADREAIRAFFTGLSAQTRYLRFFAALTITSAMLRILSGGDNSDAVVATSKGVIIGHGIAADRAGPGGARMTEIGVVVAEAWQGRGVGTALVRALISAAESRGAAIVAMEVLPGNQRVLAMIANHWPAASVDRSADNVIIRARLRPPASCSAIYADDLGLDQAAVVDVQEAECAARLPATVGRGPGIEDADAVGSLVKWYVGMPEHDQLRGRKPAAEASAPA
jgi:GNAT superfamily N-acetyltransferase